VAAIAATPVSTQLLRADARVQAALAAWNGRGAVPAALADASAAEQILELRLAADERMYRVVLPRLPARLRRDVADDVQAHRDLVGIAPREKGPPIRLGSALPALRLHAYYREGERRSGIPWRVLAAVNYVETDFGRLRENSAGGAQGPMQFMPSTWRVYGRGDVRDPHAAILGAARFLRAAGGAHDLRAALHRYNPSWAYVDAVLRYAARIRRDPHGYLALYARRLIVRTPHGLRRLTAARRRPNAHPCGSRAARGSG
jgi:hypothetical protein